MSAETKKKFAVVIERVEKTIRKTVVSANSAMEIYDHIQQEIDELNAEMENETPIGRTPDPSRSVKYHIVKIEEVKE